LHVGCGQLLFDLLLLQILGEHLVGVFCAMIASNDFDGVACLPFELGHKPSKCIHCLQFGLEAFDHLKIKAIVLK